MKIMLQIAVLFCVLIILIFYFLSVLDNEEGIRNKKYVEEKYEDAESVKVISEDEYVLNILSSIPGFNRKEFIDNSLKVINMVFNAFRCKKLDGIENLITKQLLNEFNSLVQRLHYSFINNSERKEFLYELFCQDSNLDIRFNKYIDFVDLSQEVELYVEYLLNNKTYIFVFKRQIGSVKWLLDKIK